MGRIGCGRAIEGGEAGWSFRSRVISVPGPSWSRVVFVPGRFEPDQYDPVILVCSRFGPGCFRSHVISIQGHFGLRSFRSRVVSVTGHFGPGSFRSRLIQPRFVSDLVVSVPGHFNPTSFISGSFQTGRFSVSDHGCICATYIPTYL